MKINKNQAAGVIDICIGNMLRERRSQLGLSQEELGKAIGVSFQQIQKYEKGQNRMAAARLFQLAKVLGVSTDYFFFDVKNIIKTEEVSEDKMTEQQQKYKVQIIEEKELSQLTKYYVMISDELIRKRIFLLIKSIVSPTQEI